LLGETVRDFLIRKVGWAKRNHLFWWNIVLIALAISPILARSEFWIKTLGVAFQVGGGYIVWRDLSSSVRDLGGTGIWRNTFAWLKEGFGRPKPNGSMAMTRSGSAKTGGFAYLTTGRNPNATDSARIANLERQLDEMEKSMLDLRQSVHARSTTLEKQLAAQAARHAAELTDLHERFKGALIGNYALLTFGICWVAVGVVLSTYSEGLTKLPWTAV
jgi:hypothetical protein